MQPFLNGVRVLDLSRYLPGPYATTLLADLGADVVKVEEPERGDPTRHRRPTADGRSYTYLVRNRNKSSVGIDLKDDRGRQAFLEIAETSDVVVESFRPGVCDNLGVGYDAVKAVNEDVVFCSLTGYGQRGPYADQPGHDINYIGVGGLLGMTGDPDERPRIPGFPVGDFAGGLYAAFAITAALVGVGAGRGGEYIDVSITDVVASFATVYADEYFGMGTVPNRGSTRLVGNHPGYRVYKAGDGRYLTIAALGDRFWEGLAAALGRPNLADRYIPRGADIPEARRDALVDLVAERIAERPRDEWLERFAAHDVPAGPLNEFDEVFDDPHLLERDLFGSVTVKTTDGPVTVPQIGSPVEFEGDREVEMTPGAHLGADTARLLGEVGYDEARIYALAADGVVSLGRDY